MFAIPPLLTNTYVGIREVDPDVVEAARGMGCPGGAAADAGRAAARRTADRGRRAHRRGAGRRDGTLAALVGGGGLGVIINTGFGQQDTAQIMAGGILVAGLALITEVVLAVVQRIVTPGRSRTLRWAPGGPDALG